MPYAVYGFGAHMAEIEVDIELGTVRVLKITAAHDVGRAINPTLIEGQIEGGAAQGLGMALMEEFIPGRGENLHDYLIPTVGDMPPVESILIEDAVAGRPVRRQGHRRAGADPDRPRHPQCHPRCDRRAHPPRAGDARPRPRRDPGGRTEGLTCPSPRTETDGRPHPLRCLPGDVLHQARRRRAPATATPTTTARWSGSIRMWCWTARCSRAAAWCRSAGDGDWDGKLVRGPSTFVTAIGAGTTYPDYKPAPFIVSSEVDGVDMVTVVTEGIFSYCGVKVKIDTDRHLGPERSLVRAQGEPVGHVTTGEYGSQMLSLGGVHHLTGGGKKEGRVTCDTLLELCNGKRGRADHRRRRHRDRRRPASRRWSTAQPRSGCGSAAARPPSACSPSSGTARSTRWWWSTTTSPACCPSTRRASCWACRETGIKMKGRRSTPGRYFQVARARHRLGRHRHLRPAVDPGPVQPQDGAARPDAC